MTTSSARSLLTKTGVLTSRPLAFLVVIGFTAAWVTVEPRTLDWHGVATLATWLMTLFIQRAGHRDTQAIHAKLDELLLAQGVARNSLRGIDAGEPEEIEAHREREADRNFIDGAARDAPVLP